MYNVPAHVPLACSECAAPLAGEGWGLCILCHQLFCRRHLVIRKGVPNCAACEEPRRVREQTGGVSPAEEARVVGLLARDLTNGTDVVPRFHSVQTELAVPLPVCGPCVASPHDTAGGPCGTGTSADHPSTTGALAADDAG
jgi:hypothetical protein